MKLVVSIVFLLVIGLTGLKAQENLTAAGGNISDAGGIVSYSVGQVFYETHAGTGGSIAEGVQHPYEIMVTTAIEEAMGISLGIAAYPNPVCHNLTLTVNDFGLTGLSYQLYTMNGKLLRQDKITGSKTNLAMDNLLPAVYFVQVIHENKKVKTFKIIKTL